MNALHDYVDQLLSSSSSSSSPSTTAPFRFTSVLRSPASALHTATGGSAAGDRNSVQPSEDDIAEKLSSQLQWVCSTTSRLDWRFLQRAISAAMQQQRRGQQGDRKRRRRVKLSSVETHNGRVLLDRARDEVRAVLEGLLVHSQQNADSDPAEHPATVLTMAPTDVDMARTVPAVARHMYTLLLRLHRQDEQRPILDSASERRPVPPALVDRVATGLHEAYGLPLNLKGRRARERIESAVRALQRLASWVEEQAMEQMRKEKDDGIDSGDDQDDHHVEDRGDDELMRLDECAVLETQMPGEYGSQFSRPAHAEGSLDGTAGARWYRDTSGGAFQMEQLRFEQRRSLFIASQGNKLKEEEMAVAGEAGMQQDQGQQRRDGGRGSGVGSLKWLESECKRIYGNADMAHSVLDTLERTVRSSDVEQQSILFDLLGESGIELMGDVLQHRSRLLSDHLNRRLSASGAGMTRQQQILSQVSVTTQSQKQARRLMKRESQRARRGAASRQGVSPSAAEHSWLQSAQFDHHHHHHHHHHHAAGSHRGRSRLPSAVADSERNVIIELFGEEVPELMARKTGQPLRRISHEEYEEYHLPAPERAEDTLHKNDPLVAIDEAFPDWAQLAFRGFTHLNRVQSTVFECAFKSNENMLICAPTGCGKTNVALMAILHEIGQHFRNGTLHRDEFKMIYVAPMKALAQEMVENFRKRLRPLGIVVREMTGDMQLTKREVEETQLIVTTPEKWDVVTRKSYDSSLIQRVRLLIIDEVHLLNEDRGPVIESIVARTLRQVEASQSMIRIVGLSATLPNYEDVALFLHVNPRRGLFHFDNTYRPVPLEQRFIGVNQKSPVEQNRIYNEICFEKVVKAYESNQQIMVFVHSRNDTFKTARAMVDIATMRGELDMFTGRHAPSRHAIHMVNKSHNRELRELFQYGIGIHHAGMLRSDRNLVEKMFLEGELRVLCCTATLAWGVNLPARTVVIKGTQVYDSNRGSFVELGMLDVMQIFGRAGRPQFDTKGEGIIITSYDQLPTYLRLLNHALPIESKLGEHLVNHLNAEVVLGTVTNVREALQWLGYTYLFVRMLANPMAYGIPYQDLEYDPELGGHRRKLVEAAARTLDESQMCRFNEGSGTISATDLGRVASHFYIHYETIQLFNKHLHPNMQESELLDLLSRAKEFEQIKTREDELAELDMLRQDVPVRVKGGEEMSTAGKVSTLLQAYVSQKRIKGFALVSDCAFVVQNMGRIVRALFELVMRKGWSSLVDKLLLLGKCIEKRMWAFEHPLRQFPLNRELIDRLENRGITLDELAHMDASELGDVFRSTALAKHVLNHVSQFPHLEMDAMVQPITRTVLRVRLSIVADFHWNKRFHGEVEPWWIWVEDPINEHIYHSEYFLLKHDEHDREQVIEFTIPIFEPIPTQYQVRAVSDRWVGASAMCTISFKDLVLPKGITPHTDLQPLQPLPITALKSDDFERLYRGKISHFNPVQTQVFHTLYHTDQNVLLGAPTGSGKTLVAELAILRLFREHPGAKVIYIAPLKALVRERIEDWGAKFGRSHLRRKVVELTGDVTPDIHMLRQADIVITTPEKWDGISRNWQKRDYVKSVGLVIMDEIHMLGQDRGPILEVIVSRMRYIGWKTGRAIRLLGLSTALANAKDLADWLGIHGNKGLYNFRPQVRPVPLQAHIQGYSGKNYCPRMATMNKPAYHAILTHSRNKPTLVFVSSRRQTRLTAIDLISFCAGDENPRQFLRMGEDQLQEVLAQVQDSNLRHALSFGIGIHHAGLASGDKHIVEHLFLEEKILVLVCTSTLAWGVNFPARLVVIKGTEFFDPKLRRYVDYPITDVLQMMGRAGRPGYDDKGIAVIMVEESKKDFYKKFLYEPFPVESSLHSQLHDHINAEIASGTIRTGQDAVDWLTWTFMFRRLIQNPAYYGVEDPDTWDGLNKWLSALVEGILKDLVESGCIAFERDDVKKDEDRIVPTALGFISSFYYLSHRSAARFMGGVTRDASIELLLQLLSQSEEYAELPVRHNEDLLNKDLSKVVRYGSFSDEYGSPHVKTYLLLQAHFSRVKLPIVDYVTDTKTVMDNTIRLLQAYVDMVAERGFLSCCLKLMTIMQMVMQGMWFDESSILSLPHMRDAAQLDEDGEGAAGDGDKEGSRAGHSALIKELEKRGYRTLLQLVELDDNSLRKLLVSCARDKFGGSGGGGGRAQAKLREICAVKSRLPRIDVKLELYVGSDETTIRAILTRLSKMPAPGQGAYTPRYMKSKDESFWVVIGDAEKDELLALKRATIRQRQSRVDLVVPIVDSSNRKLTVFLIPDCYLGLDQQHQFEI